MLSLLFWSEGRSDGTSASSSSYEESFDEFGNPQAEADEDEEDGTTELAREFRKASARLRTSKGEGLGDSILLQLYGLYKQALEGAADPRKKPGILAGIVARQKWDAWAALKDLSKDEAMTRYIDIFHKFSPKEEAGAKKAKGGFGAGVSRPLPSSNTEEPEPDDPSIIAAAKRLEDGEEMAAWLEERKREIGEENFVEELESRDSAGLTALHWAADRGWAATAEALLDQGASFDATDEDGQTPLHYAGACDHVKLAKLLLKRGADPSALDNEGNPPLSSSQFLKCQSSTSAGSLL